MTMTDVSRMPGDDRYALTASDAKLLSELRDDPTSFFGKYTLSMHNMTDSPVLGVPDKGFARLHKRRDDIYEVRCVFDRSTRVDDRVPAYFLGYNAGAQSSNTPAWVDIPIQAPSGTLLFTGTLSGCTVIVTELNEKTYRVFHDARLNSAGIYDRVVMATNHMDYQSAENNGGFAAAMMHHDGVSWRLITQGQIQGPLNLSDPLPPERKLDANGKAFVDVSTPDKHYPETFQRRMRQAREHAQSAFKREATKLGMAPRSIEDGEYRHGSGYAHDHEAFAGWTSYVNDAKEVLQERIKANDALIAKLEQQGATGQVNGLKEVSKRLKAERKTLGEAVMDAERSWLWQRIKDADGASAAVDLNGPKIGLGEKDLTLGERYAYRHDQLSRDADFTHGRLQSEKIKLPADIASLPVAEKKREFLKEQLSNEQLGALSVLISRDEKKAIAVTLEKTAVLADALSRPGADYKLLMSQELFLRNVLDDAAGRCYPLVRAMAVALANHGVDGVTQLNTRIMLAAANPAEPESKLLRDALSHLHGDVRARNASSLPVRQGIDEIVSKLAGMTSSRVYALNTNAHAMLVAFVAGSQAARFFFYDPNVGVFGYSSSDKLSAALHAHLSGTELAEQYQVFGKRSQPLFDLVEIKPELMGSLVLNGGLTVADLSGTESLAHVADGIARTDAVVRRVNVVGADLKLKAGLTVTEARDLGERFFDAMHALADRAGLTGRWMPVIDTIQRGADRTSRIQFIDTRMPHDERWLETEDKSVVELKDFVDEHGKALARQFKVDKDRIIASHDVTAEVGAMDGLNAGFAIQTLIDWFGQRERERTEQGQTPPALAMALTVHSYLNLAQVAHGTLEDVAKLTGIVRALLQEEPVAQGVALGAFSKAFGHAFGAFGLASGIASIGLDIFELTQAENAAQKGVFGTQLAFDSASLVTGIGGTVAGVVGASTAGVMLGGAGVILGGLAVGFTGLARALGDVAEQVLRVGRYFAAVEQAYRSGGYKQDTQDGTPVLTPMPGAVVRRIDLAGKRIEFDTQYIYRTRHGSTGSGKINYFFWAGDFPTVVHDRAQAIDVRAGIGCEPSHVFDHGEARVLILPATPKSYISYSYGPFAGITTRHDTGLDVVRRLEEDYRFDFDFYIFPGEQAVNSLHHEFVQTVVDIDLDGHDMTLITPILPKANQGVLSYRIVGAGARYTVVVNQGSAVTLSGKTTGPKSSFVLSTDVIQTAAQVQVHADRIDCGATRIAVDGHAIESIHIVTGTRALLRVDLAKQSVVVVSEDASGWTDPNVTFKAHLAQQAKDNPLISRITLIENYRVHDKEVGRAFYDATDDRILFTDCDSALTRRSQLVGVTRDAAYFVNEDRTAIWSSHIETGAVQCWFAPWFYRGPDDLHRVWQESDGIYIQCRFDYVWKGLLTYRIDPETKALYLLSAAGDDALLKQLARTAALDAPVHVTMLLDAYGKKFGPWQVPSHAKGEIVTPVADDVIMIFGTDNDGVAHRYWLRPATGVLIKPNLAAVGASPHKTDSPSGPSGNIRSAEPIPDDLTFVGSRTKGLEQEYFYFYSSTLGALFGQSGPGQAILDAGHPTAIALDTGALENVIRDRSAMALVRQDGQVFEIADDRSYQKVAVNSHWLAAQACWWKALAGEQDKQAVFAIFGLTSDTPAEPVPAWYCKGSIVVAGAQLRGKMVQLLDVDQEHARLFCPSTQKVYIQPRSSDAMLERAFGTGAVLREDVLPSAESVDLGVPVAQVQVVPTGLRLTTPDGLIYLRRTSTENLLIGATGKWWQAQTDPQAALSRHAAQGPARDVLTIYRGDTKAWFDVGQSRLYDGSVLDHDAVDDAAFLGTSADRKEAYVYSRSQATVYGLDFAPHRYRMGDVRRIDTCVTAQPLDGADVTPMLHGQDTLVLGGRPEATTWDLYRCWFTGGTVILSAENSGGVTLILPVDLNPYLMCRYGDDLFVIDPESRSTLVVRDAFLGDKPPHVTLRGRFGQPTDRTVEQLLTSYESRSSVPSQLMTIGG